MELFFAYLAGLLTLINPCVLPILPIILASSLQVHRHGPLAVAAGMSFTFVTLAMLVAVAGRAVGLTEQDVSNAGAVLMIGFGLVLVLPRLSAGFATATAGLSSGANVTLDGRVGGGLGGQVATGALMGAVWSPCIGPTFGAAIGLASQGERLLWSATIMLFFAFGVSTIILAFGYGARAVIVKRQALMRTIAEKSRPAMGAVFILVGTAILLHWPRTIEIWLLDNMPAWLLDFSVSV